MHVTRDCEFASRQISADLLQGGAGQHATEVEPDSFSFGTTVVAVFQVGRISDGGATAIGFATSVDSGRSWRGGLLPGVTSSSPDTGSNPRASDPVVGYDATHGVWLASSLGIAPGRFQILVSRSLDGVQWGAPVVVREASSLDKEWVACDNWPSSPNHGRCYVSYLEPGNTRIVTQTSIDGGVTWGIPVQTSIQPAAGLEPNGAQPLPRPNGSLVVVYLVIGRNGPTLGDELLAARSDDGGATFGASVRVADLRWTGVPQLRAPPLPSADVGADGTLCVAWADCRLDPGCARQRILVTSSADGATWTTPAPVSPATAVGAGQFVPGLALDPATTGAAKRLAVAYYSMTSGAPLGRIDAWLVTSADAGATWTAPQRLDAQPIELRWLPFAGGLFLGDYISVSYLAGRPMPVYSLAVQPGRQRFNQAIMALVR